VKRFFDHYFRLGVDDFLVIVHAPENDQRLTVIKDIMNEYGVLPQSIVRTYSAPLKRARCTGLVQQECVDSDWVLYADIDELQTYPEALGDFLSSCDNQGYSLVRGLFVDRVTEDGQLAEFSENTDLWEQFPYVAEVTSSITGGWVNKVCAAKGWRKVADGGAHALDYGVDGKENYARTLKDATGHPDTIQVHHFKWDAGLLRRLADKLNFSGGDRDSVDGTHFIDEYRRLDHHLKENNGLLLDSMQFAGTPELHYVDRTAAESHHGRTE